jgi:hypothetical protein
VSFRSFFLLFVSSALSPSVVLVGLWAGSVFFFLGLPKPKPPPPRRRRRSHTPPQNPEKIKTKNSPGPKQYLPRVLTAGIDETAARQATDKARSVLNHALQLGGRVLSGEDLGLSLRAAVLLFFSARLGRIITPVGLLYLAVLALFTLPKVYELRKDELDAAHDAVRRQAGAVAAQARAQVGDVVSRLTPRKAAAAAGAGKAE